tara:strand:- start:1553 stop:2464 length:912 start_codon:yes stop_codon:yes gene_type:complete
MPHKKGHKDPAKKASKKATPKPPKRGDRRPDGSIVGGIVRAKPTKAKTNGKAPSKKDPFKAPKKVSKNEIDKTTGKKYDDSENGRKERLKREQAAGMRDEMGYQTSSYESGGAAPKNLGTVSGGTAFYKTGPLYAHEAGHTDPTKEAKAKAAAEAKKKHDASGKVYGKATKTKSTKDGVTTYTMSRPWTKKGTGSSGGKNLGPGYKPSAAETARANAAKNSSGVDTRSHTSFNIKPVGIKITPMLPTAKINPPRIPTNTKKAPPPPSLTSFKGKSGTYSLKGIDTSGRGGRTSKRSSSSCGCN